MRTVPATLTLLTALVAATAAAAEAPVIRSAKSGSWSAADTWEGGRVPAAGAKVQIRTGHRIVYDVQSDAAIRTLHIGGTLTFAADRDTRLDVGLLKIQAGDDVSENGFDCEAHLKEPDPALSRPALEVGTPDRPIDSRHTALIRLVSFDGMDRETCPAIVCCGGRMDFHGAPLNHAWVKLGATAKAGDSTVTLAEAVTGWRVGDRVIVTATKLTNDIGDRRGRHSTEERVITAIDGAKVTLDRPLEREHLGTGDYRGEVANLSRNVVVESADPAKARGHTMYHKYSAGSISYAEFRHLGKEGVLGKYALHFHLCGDTMRGSSVIGASIWDSGNRWLTIHGTNYLVVRDCVGYRSVGHGFYLEDGTEVQNVLDHNLAVQASRGKPLPKQALPFDQNDGAGFWWANCLNTFTRNVSCENHLYGYRFEATKTSALDVTLPVQGPDGERRPTDIRTLPFVRFEGNEAHCDGLYGFNLGEGVNRVGPDEKHPFVIRDMKIWEIHYAFRPQSPCVLVENMTLHQSVYGVYHPNYDRHVYRNLVISRVEGNDAEPFNRGHDDDSVQYGVLVVDGLTFAGHRNHGMPLIQMSDDNPTGTAETHMRNVKVIDRHDGNKRALVNRGGGPRPTPKTPTSVPVFLHDWYGPGQDAKVMSTAAKDYGKDGLTYTADVPLTGDESRVAKVTDIKFPDPLHPVDDLPPATVITRVERRDGKVIVRGTTSDNGTVAKVMVNGQAAKALAANFVQWEAVLNDVKTGEVKISAGAEDAAGNVEKRPHVVVVNATQEGK
jgi:hypothetical protein